MERHSIKVVLIIAVILLLQGCAGPKKSYYYRFAGEQTEPHNALVLSERQAHTTIRFESERPGVSVFAYDEDTGKKTTMLGKTPCTYNLVNYNITDYADNTKGYEVIINIPHVITRRIDYSDPANTTGEITFAFWLERKGEEPRIEHVAVSATHAVLLKALSNEPLPDYEVMIQ